MFLKAGEEWTTIAKTKGKKKTKPEDEWQEVGHVVHIMNWIYLCKSFIAILGGKCKKGPQEKGVCRNCST